MAIYASVYAVLFAYKDASGFGRAKVTSRELSAWSPEFAHDQLPVEESAQKSLIVMPFPRL